MWRLWHILQCASCTYLQQSRPCNCMSQQSEWQTHISCKTSLPFRQIFAENPSSIRSVVDQRGVYTRGAIDWIYGVTQSSSAYGIDRLMPSPISNLVILSRHLPIIECQRSWIGGIKSRRISTLSTSVSKTNYPFVLSVDGILWREAMVILANLSQLMA